MIARRPLTMQLTIAERFQTALFLSVTLHAAILFGITYKPPKIDPFGPLNALEVVLVNSKSEMRPDDATALAQANLDGGGNTDLNRRAKSPLPVTESKGKELSAAVPTPKRKPKQKQAAKAKPKPPIQVTQPVVPAEQPVEPEEVVQAQNVAALSDEEAQVAAQVAQLEREAKQLMEKLAQRDAPQEPAQPLQEPPPPEVAPTSQVEPPRQVAQEDVPEAPAFAAPAYQDIPAPTPLLTQPRAEPGTPSVPTSAQSSSAKDDKTPRVIKVEPRGESPAEPVAINPVITKTEPRPTAPARVQPVPARTPPQPSEPAPVPQQVAAVPQPQPSPPPKAVEETPPPKPPAPPPVATPQPEPAPVKTAQVIKTDPANVTALPKPEITVERAKLLPTAPSAPVEPRVRELKVEPRREAQPEAPQITVERAQPKPVSVAQAKPAEQKPQPEVKPEAPPEKVERVEKAEPPAAKPEPRPEAKPEATAAPAEAPKIATLAPDAIQRSAEIARLEAQIAQDWDNYQKRPRRKFIGARTKEFRFAQYVEEWRVKVERVGNLNYPEAAKRKRLYGSLQVTVAIKSDGHVESIEVNRSSGQKILDAAAKRIVELAGPYSPFPPELSKDTDILHVTRTWTFTRSDQLISE